MHYRIRKCPSPVSIVSQLEPVHTPTSLFLKFQFNIILPSTTGSPRWSLSLWIPHQNAVYAFPLPHTCYMPRHIILLDYIFLLCAVLQIGRSLVRSQLVPLEFFIDIKSYRSHYCPGIDSASNRNEYQEHFLGVKAAGT